MSIVERLEAEKCNFPDVHTNLARNVALCHQAAARIRQLEAAAQHAIVNCGKCWGNGHHYNSKDDKVDCKVCAPLRAALKEPSK